MKKIRVMSVFGTRPEAIKMCPLVLELQSRPEFESIVCVTAQHREMLDSVLETFGVKPDYDLDIMEKGQTLASITAKVLGLLGGVIREAKPDIVLVHGDTTTTFVSALAAFYEQVPVGHVEAGLRTFTRYSPFPEEMNRCLVGRIAEYHFAPTAQNKMNLTREAIAGQIYITGNTVIDAMKYTVNDEPFTEPRLNDIDFSRRVITLTCHRRENYGKPMEDIFTAVADVARAFPDTLTDYPVHLSPTVRECAARFLGGIDNVMLIDPLDAMDMHKLMDRSYMVMTDSGGLQEEAPALGKPVLVLRLETERPEAIEAGTVKLAGIDRDNIFRLASELLTDSEAYAAMARAVNPYGDGEACGRIADALLYGFGLRDSAPEDFTT
ncbi:MAG: UDP-N-acetylglucosamine 2-epimerase (non-hydrolyzing) [Clostridia bacterium]|nr:UDP-N-acetylglucosamine 2-epimerase (non-hydrolyzing) [Clostridia bacterium]